MKQSLYITIATAVGAYHRCYKKQSHEWFDRWSARLEWLAKNHLPSGSGFDCGTSIDAEASTESRIVLHTSFHHMDGGGGYDGWTEHKITLVPSFIGGFDLHISGRDRNGIKEHIAQCFGEMLRADVDYPEGV